MRRLAAALYYLRDPHRHVSAEHQVDLYIICKTDPDGTVLELTSSDYLKCIGNFQ